MSVIAVLGATGIQGGSVVQQLQKSPSWKIRAITRNSEGKSAKELQSQGIEVVQGDLDDVGSLEAAFQGSTAIFTVTNFWQSPAADADGLEQNGKREYQQIINVGRAASQISTLKHLIISSLPRPQKVSGGKHRVPHMDYKGRAVEEVETQFPALAAKITSLWVGWYATNLAFFPTMKPLLWPAAGKYAWLMPSKPNGKVPIAGDVSRNVGVVVERILERPAQTQGKIVVLVVEYKDHTDVLKIWEKVTRKEAAYVELTDEAAAALIGPLAVEIGAQLRFSEEHPDWGTYEPERTVKLADIGLGSELSGLEDTLIRHSESLL
ncbi:hypothetical protein NM208_g713 [Fusarium decemcellulare]|uniref:Uncharacterized protein n=1 Tax=Fusarium decemcellulare TaxID=57161 RepID=A0ACC1SYT4_9HYPO|nr:hypothetical protein NM208_g713 [Fusarium decemcellulare]